MNKKRMFLLSQVGSCTDEQLISLYKRNLSILVKKVYDISKTRVSFNEIIILDIVEEELKARGIYLKTKYARGVGKLPILVEVKKHE